MKRIVFFFIGLMAMSLISCDEDETLTSIVKFETGIETSVPSQNVNLGEFAALPEQELVKGDSIFSHWSLDGKKFEFETTPIVKDITLYAKYILNPEMMKTVSFSTGCKQVVPDQKLKKGTKLPKPTVQLTKTDSVFTHWTLNGKQYDFNTVVTTDLSLVAKWEFDNSLIKTVNFDTGIQETLNPQKVKSGNKATEPSHSLAKLGHSFKYWMLGNTRFDFNTYTVTEDITLTAKWEANTYTVSFSTGTSAKVDDQTITYGALVTKPAAPTRAGYSFKYWALNGAEFDFQNATVSADLDLEAEWELEEKTEVVYAGISRADYDAWTYGDMKLVKGKLYKKKWSMGAWGCEVYMNDYKGGTTNDRGYLNGYAFFSHPYSSSEMVAKLQDKSFVYKVFKNTFMSTPQFGFGGTRATSYNGQKWLTPYTYGIEYFDEAIRGDVQKIEYVDGVGVKLSTKTNTIIFDELTAADVSKFDAFKNKNVYVNCIKKDGKWYSKLDHTSKIQVSETIGGTGNPYQ